MKLKIATIVVLLLFSVGCAATQCDEEVIKTYFDVEVRIEGPLTIEVVEERQSVQASDDTRPLPFGRINSSWEAFKSEIEAGDCIFFFTTSRDTWLALHGREGYMLVRGNEPFLSIITKSN